MAAFIAVVTGHFKGFILFSIIILVHEFGHVLMGILFWWKIDKIIILPFGALTVFQEDLNRRIFEEFLIVIMGPIFQIVFTWILCEFGDFNRVFDYSMAILCFNLLPIYPLDGGRILKGILHIIFGKRKAEKYINNISFVCLIIITLLGSIAIFYIQNVAFFIIIICLWVMYVKEDIIHKRKNKIYNLIEKTIEINANS